MTSPFQNLGGTFQTADLKVLQCLRDRIDAAFPWLCLLTSRLARRVVDSMSRRRAVQNNGWRVSLARTDILSNRACLFGEDAR